MSLGMLFPVSSQCAQSDSTAQRMPWTAAGDRATEANPTRFKVIRPFIDGILRADPHGHLLTVDVYLPLG
jgi:hypothetical protein